MGNKSSQQTNSQIEEDNNSIVDEANNDANHLPIPPQNSASSPPTSPRNNENDPPVSNKTSFWNILKDSYQSLVSAIIRPPRCQYTVQQLGPKSFYFCRKSFVRKDFELTNERGLKLMCSIWGPIDYERRSEKLPCVIYMHGNSSSRLEAIGQLSCVLSLGATLFAFDFSGSGLSEGEYVSLGAFEKEDLKCVIDFLRTTGTTSTIALWGRSMGAATCLLHGVRDPSIAGMILDSPFADLVMLAEEMVDHGRKQGLFAPGFAVKIAIRWIRSSVLKAANFDIKALTPIDCAETCFIPALFVAGENDQFVNKHHSELIYERYGGDKQLIILEGADHNSMRPEYFFLTAGEFLKTRLMVDEDSILYDGQLFSRRPPWQLSFTNHYYASSPNCEGGAQEDNVDRQQVAYDKNRCIIQSPTVANGKMRQALDGDHNALNGELDVDELLALSLMEMEMQNEDDGGAGLDFGLTSDMQQQLHNQIMGLNLFQGTGQKKPLNHSISVKINPNSSHHEKDVTDSSNHRNALDDEHSDSGQTDHNGLDNDMAPSSKLPPTGLSAVSLNLDSQFHNQRPIIEGTQFSDEHHEAREEVNASQQSEVLSHQIVADYCGWVCSICTLINKHDSTECDGCGSDRT